MNRHFWIPIGCATLCVLLTCPWWVARAAGEGGFDGVVDSIESHYHAHAMRVPMMGLASFAAGAVTRGGVAGLHVAVFQQFSDAVDGDDLNRMAEEKLGQGWDRMIRETSRHGNEQTLIFSHPEGNRMGLFVLDLDDGELSVVQVSVDPDRLNETIIKYKHHDGDGGDSEK